MSEPATERIVANDPLNERQEDLLKQALAGKVTEDLIDTEAQLLTLARMGHLDLGTDTNGDYTFSAPPGSSGKKGTRSKS
jgi:hypothetical protein